MPRLERDDIVVADPPPAPPAPERIMPTVESKPPLRERQPVAIAGTIATLPAVVWNLADAFGWFTLTGAQRTAVEYAYSVLLVIVFWLLSGQVYSPATVAQIKADK